MGLQIRLLFTDSKEKLNVVVEDVDKNTKKCKRTMLDIMVDIQASNANNVSDIDELSKDELNSQNSYGWNSIDDVLGEELGLEISTITGNARTLNAASSNENSESSLAAVVSMAEKCTLSDKEEEAILEWDFSVNVDPNIANSKEKETNKPDEEMIETTVMEEDTIINATYDFENNDTEKTQNDSVIIKEPSTPSSCSKNEDPLAAKNKDQKTPSSCSKKEDALTLSSSLKNKNQMTPSAGSKNEKHLTASSSSKIADQTTPSSCSKNEDSLTLSSSLKNKHQSTLSPNSRIKDPSTPSTSATSSKKNILGNSKSPKDIAVKSNAHEKKGRNAQSDDCEILIVGEDEMDFDDYEEIDSWHLGDNTSSNASETIVDLTDHENVDPISTPRSDSVRSCGSVSVLFDGSFVAVRRARSNPPENLVKSIDDEDYETRSDDGFRRAPQVVDLTSERDVECVDLTTDRRTGLIIQRSPNEVINELRNFYASNKDHVANQENALRALGQKINMRSGIEAPPKLNNGLPYRKRCSSVIHESDIKFSRASRSPGLRERNRNSESADRSRSRVRSLNEMPSLTCGPAGFRLNDDFSIRETEWPKEEGMTDDLRYSNAVPNLCGQEMRRYNFSPRRGSRRNRGSLMARNNRFHPKTRGKRFSKRFGQNHISPLRRENSTRTIQPTQVRGEVWLDMKQNEES